MVGWLEGQWYPQPIRFKSWCLHYFRWLCISSRWYICRLSFSEVLRGVGCMCVFIGWVYAPIYEHLRMYCVKKTAKQEVTKAHMHTKNNLGRVYLRNGLTWRTRILGSYKAHTHPRNKLAHTYPRNNLAHTYAKLSKWYIYFLINCLTGICFERLYCN